MNKIALFYQLWFDSGERFLEAAKKLKVDLVPIQYDDLVMRQLEILYQGKPLSDFDLFYFRAVGQAIEWANLLIFYTKQKKIPAVDEYLKIWGPQRRLKSIAGVILNQAGVFYPRTSFASQQKQLVKEAINFQFPFVLKISKGGRHGVGTFLIKDKKTLTRIIKGRIEKTGFLIQEYIANDGDYRLFLIGYKTLGGFKRQRKEERLVLNRSAGPSVGLKRIPKAVQLEAEKAVRALKVEIAAVDLVIDKRSGKPVVIEVNEAPQFRIFEKRTGIDVAEAVIKYLAKKASQ